MDYENRLTTLKHLFDVLTKKLQAEPTNANTAKLQESQFHLQQIQSEIERISKMRSYKK
jgi:hypothetical protein